MATHSLTWVGNAGLAGIGAGGVESARRGNEAGGRVRPTSGVKREAENAGIEASAAATHGAAKAEGWAEAEVVRLAQQGDGGAFEQIYQQHKRRVYALCLRMAGNPCDAEELTQEAFMQLFRKIHTFRGDSSFPTWLHRLTVNVVLMRFRKKKLAEVSLEQQAEPDDEVAPKREFGETDLRLSGVIDRLNLQRAIEQLPAGYKEMFLLHDVEGYDHTEIAEIVGCSVGNSKSQLHKARARLRKLLREQLRQRARARRKAPGNMGAKVLRPAMV
jgi:RNA polymerase sigma-70 factor, ECF subfamily